MSYTLTMGHGRFQSVDRYANKDDVINFLLMYINGDGGGPYLRLEYPDGSYFEFIGDDD